MASRPTHIADEFEFLSADSLSHLNYQQLVLYLESWNGFIEFLRNRGKNPDRHRGYSESNVRPIARRTHQVHHHYWKQNIIITELDRTRADQFIENLNQDEILNRSGNSYSEGSKRKFSQALEAYFRYQGEEWESKITFSESEINLGSDPFTRREREQLLNASLEYKTPPSYSNVTPDERDRWNVKLAQALGKPKKEVGPDDWDELKRDWKIPSIIATALDGAWRAALVGRLKDNFVDLDNGRITIPPKTAVKNDLKWETELSKRATKILEKWLEQRANKAKYDDTNHLWLNRKGNPYGSATLNDLLSNLIEEAGIEAKGRKLTWHSIRHSTGMYVYNQEKDLELVAEVLRQASLEAAKKYAHPTPETKQNVIESIQGGGLE